MVFIIPLSLTLFTVAIQYKYMDEFISGKVLSDEERKKIYEDREKFTKPITGKYVDRTLYKGVTEKNAFDFEENKRELIKDLDKLSHMEVEEFTFRKKWEEIQLLPDFITEYGGRTKAKIWQPTDIDNEELTVQEINSLKPMVVVVDESLERTWTVLRYYCSSAEYNQAPGRFIKFLMMDEISDKVLGICSIASDVISISDRDKFIGWTPENKLKDKLLKHSAIGTTIVPTQPFGSNFLGGKLIASLVTSGVVRNEWENQTRGVSNSCKLVGMTTTSLYGGFSMYNSLKWWKPVGMSKGKIPIKPYEKGYGDWHGWLKQNMKKDYDEAMTQKEGVAGPVTGAKMRVLSMIFKACGIKQSDYCHGYERGVYYSCFYENTKEFLCNKITEDKLVMKQLFKDDTNAIVEWWRPKAIERYKRLKAEGRLNPNKLFYDVMGGMPYDKAKGLFYNAARPSKRKINMGRTFRKNDRWKKDRRDQNFRKSKKFKDFKKGFVHPKLNLPETILEPMDIENDNSNL